MLFFVGTLFPVLGFCNVYPFIYSYVADHFLYLACLGVITLASAGVADRIRQLAISLSRDGVSWTVGYRHDSKPAFGGADGNPLVWRPDTVRAARFVRISLEVANYLHLDEVQVSARLGGIARHGHAVKPA